MSSPARGDIDVDASCCSDDSFRGEAVSACGGLKAGELADIIYWVGSIAKRPRRK